MPNNKQETEPHSRGLLYYLRRPFDSSIVGMLAHRYAQPALYLAEDIARRNITIPLKKKVGMGINPEVKTEDDFSEAYLNTLDSINVANLDKKVPNWRKRTARGETVTILVKGSDYIKDYGWANPRGKRRGLLSRLTNPVQQIETTLGTYKVTATKDNIVTDDVYDFDRKTKIDTSTPYGKLRALANYIATPEDGGVPKNEKIQTHITSKRTKQ